MGEKFKYENECIYKPAPYDVSGVEILNRIQSVENKISFIMQNYEDYKKIMNKIFNPRIKARIRKNSQVLNKNIDNFFGWVKGAKLIELKECNTEEDPVRPELDNKFRTGFGRKIYGVEYKGEVHAVMCFAYTNEIPKSVDELEKLSTDAFLQSAMRDQSGGQIAIAYTVWSKKKGGGKLIVKEVFKKIKKSNHLNRLVTLSPLTEMATNFHVKNGAKLIQINETTQNFEYKV